jgi:hypothetical protein
MFAVGELLTEKEVVPDERRRRIKVMYGTALFTIVQRKNELCYCSTMFDGSSCVSVLWFVCRFCSVSSSHHFISADEHVIVD